MNQSKPTEQSARSKIARHCLIHTIVSATPSFALAIIFGLSAPAQIIGMLIGISAFLFSAVVVHLTKPMLIMIEAPVSSRALRWAKTIRLVHALLVLPSFFIPVLGTLILPDMWAGMFANIATERLGFSTPGPAAQNNAATITDQFLQAFLATFIEGWILAAAVSVLCLVFWAALRIGYFMKSRPAVRV